MSATDLSPFGDNILYEGVFDRQDEEPLIQEYIDFPRQGIQITGGARHNEAIAFARRMKAALVRAGLSTIVFYRFSTDDNVHGHWADGRWEEKMTPSFAAAWLHETAQGGLVPSYNNEPNAGTLDEIANHAKETLIHLNERKAPPVVMLNWHTGFIEDLEKRYGGEFDEVYRLMEARGDYAGFHGYMNTRFLDDPKKPLYIGRHRYVVPAKKFPRLKKVYTEFGFDSHKPNPQCDGYKNHKELWAQIFPGKEAIDVYWDEAVKADEAILAHDNVIVLWFCRYHNSTSRWTAFNYADEAKLIGRMKTYRRQSMPTDFGTMYEAVVTSAYTQGSVVRGAPATSGTELTRLFPGDAIRISENFQVGGALNWHKVIVGNVEGYTADTNDFAWERVPTLPEPEVPDGLYSAWLTADEIQQLASLHTALAAGYRVMAEDHDSIAALYRTAAERT